MELWQSEKLMFEHDSGRFYNLEFLDAKANVAIFKDTRSEQYAVVSNPSITNDKKIEWDFSYGYYQDMESARETYVLKTVSSEEVNRLIEVAYIKEQLPYLANEQVNEIYSMCNRAYDKDESGLARYKIVESITERIRNDDITISDINKASPWDVLDSVIMDSDYALKNDDVKKENDDLAYEMEI